MLIKNSVLYSLGNIVSKAFAFILLPLYTAYLNPSDFGVVNSMQVFSSLIAVIFSFGLERSIYRLYYDYPTDTEKRDFIGTIIISMVLISSIIMFSLFLGNKLITKMFRTIEFYPFYSFAILSSYFSIFEIVPKIIYQVNQKASKFLVISLLQLVINTSTTVWFVVFLKQGAIGMLKGALIGHLLTLPIFLFISIKNMNIIVRKVILKKSLLFSLPMIPGLLSSWVYNLSDRVFIEHYYSNYEVGIYSLGYKIGQVVQLFSGAILMAYNPFFYKLANSQDQEDAKNVLFSINKKIIILMLILGFICSFFSKDIILLFFDVKYNQSYKIIPLIILGYFFIQLISLQNLSFYQEKKTIVIMYINILAAIFNISLNFLLISRFGLYGAALSTLITQLLFFILIYHFAKKYYFIPYDFKTLTTLLLIFCLIITFNMIFVPVNFFIFFIKIFLVTILTLICFYLFKKQLVQIRKDY